MDRLFRATVDETAARWTLRISGDEQLAHYGALAREAIAGAPTKQAGVSDGGSSGTGEEGVGENRPLGSWFSGAVEVPLRVERQASPSPVRRWRILPP